MGFKSEVREKLDAIVTKQADHTTELAVYNQSLKEHMRRTDIAEKAQTMLEARVVPIEHHVIFISKAAKIVLTLLTAATAIMSILHFIR